MINFVGKVFNLPYSTNSMYFNLLCTLGVSKMLLYLLLFILGANTICTQCKCIFFSTPVGFKNRRQGTTSVFGVKLTHCFLLYLTKIVNTNINSE